MDEALKMLQELAGKIGGTAEEMWPHAVRYTRVSALIALTGGIVAFIIGSILIGLCFKVGFFMSEDNEWSDDSRGLIAAVCGFLGFFTLVIGFCVALEKLPAFLEPIGATIKMICGG